MFVSLSSDTDGGVISDAAVAAGKSTFEPPLDVSSGKMDQ